MEHWTRFLPEAGHIQDIADEAEPIMAQIARLQRVLAELERDALERARQDWSDEEIQQAKADAGA